ncbi:MAG: mycothiol synthase [Actinobacteria bacterium]|nr:mycothiol synthase [Actinomycetota bacterium]
MTTEVDASMRSAGRHLVRLLHQMRRPLPLGDDLRERTRAVTTRPFVPGVDDDAWLAVNNRAFRWHPDQGGWDRARLDARLAESWVRTEGFLLHDGPAGTVDGFCWTREHPATPGGADPAMGEIFVIAADPSTVGSGLGRSLTVAGLDHLSARGLELAMLYVEAVNTPAVRLYERLGFVVHHSNAAYAAT